MERVPTRRRRMLSWLPSVVLVVLIAGFAVAAIGVNNSWWVDPTPTAAPDQTAPNGSSVFTGAGVDYLGRTGVVVVHLDEESLSAAELGLEPDGERVIPSARPLIVQVFGPDGALVVADGSELTLTTEGGELVAVDVLVMEPDGFVAANAELAQVADLYGWSPDELETLPERFGDARRENPGAPTSVSVGPGTETGLAVSATLTVDGGAALNYTAERVP